MTKSYSIGIGVLLVLLTTSALAKNFLYGSVTEVDATSFCIRARFRPRVPLSVNDKTTFYCGHRPLPMELLRVGDDVQVRFKPKKDAWWAEEVKIRGKDRDCAARIATSGRR